MNSPEKEILGNEGEQAETPKKPESLDDFLGEIKAEVAEAPKKEKMEAIPEPEGEKIDTILDKAREDEERAKEERERVLAIEQLGRLGEELKEARDRVSVSVGAEIYAVLNDDIEDYRRFHMDQLASSLDAERKTAESWELEAKNGLGYDGRGGYRHYTDEEWRKHTNSSTGIKEAFTNAAEMKKREIEGNERNLTSFSERTPESLAIDIKFSKKELAERKRTSMSRYNEVIPEGSVQNPEQLVGAFKEMYAYYFDHGKKDHFSRWGKNSLGYGKIEKASEGVCTAALEEGDTETVARVLAFLESTPNGIPPSLLEKVKSIVSGLDTEKKQAFVKTLESEKRRQRNYKKEIETKSEKPIYA